MGYKIFLWILDKLSLMLVCCVLTTRKVLAAVRAISPLENVTISFKGIWWFVGELNLPVCGWHYRNPLQRSKARVQRLHKGSARVAGILLDKDW